MSRFQSFWFLVVGLLIVGGCGEQLPNDTQAGNPATEPRVITAVPPTTNEAVVALTVPADVSAITTSVASVSQELPPELKDRTTSTNDPAFARFVADATGQDISTGRSIYGQNGELNVTEFPDQSRIVYSAGLPVQFIDSNGAQTKYSFDNAGRLMSRLNANGRKDTFSYDPNGNRTTNSTPSSD